MSGEINFREENENWTSSQPDDENQTKEKFNSTGEGGEKIKETEEIIPGKEMETEESKEKVGEEQELTTEEAEAIERLKNEIEEEEKKEKEWIREKEFNDNKWKKIKEEGLLTEEAEKIMKELEHGISNRDYYMYKVLPELKSKSEEYKKIKGSWDYKVAEQIKYWTQDLKRIKEGFEKGEEYCNESRNELLKLEQEENLIKKTEEEQEKEGIEKANVGMQEIENWIDLEDKELLTDEGKKLLKELKGVISVIEGKTKILFDVRNQAEVFQKRIDNGEFDKKIVPQERFKNPKIDLKEREIEMKKLEIDYTYLKEKLRKLKQEGKLEKKIEQKDEEINEEVNMSGETQEEEPEKKGILESLKGLFGKK